ncbi:DUF4232 domain-containing protein [Streptomyces sp. NBC_00820]|uniref:DUF4232 domain-containing protein n=1 Tax=Streptomyces sp. NBC_00820 TaxID=2975842 RepID=UPI002ED34BF1|nr:DUF4232 domain-containing protein [Streptomyces sp. NBC_00820]
MRLRAAHAVPAVLSAATALLLSAPQSQAAAPHLPRAAPCAQGALTLRAKAASADPSVVRFSVTNRGAACVVDRVPTVTFGDLDGAALPVPEGGAGTYRIATGATAYAAVRTIADPADPEARRVDAITVAASASQWGRTFTAARLGTGADVRVWEPVTTWWRPTAAAADRAIGLS